MTATLQIEVKSDLRKLASRYRRFRARVQGDLLNRVAQKQAKFSRDRVRTFKEDPQLDPWDERKSDREKHPLMVKTGRLLRSIRAARESKELINVGTDVEYAIFHHLGTKKMVQRQAVGVGEADVSDLDRLINSWVESHAF